VTLGELVSEGNGWFFTMELVEGGEDFVSWVTGDSGLGAGHGAFGFDEVRLRAALTELALGLHTLHEAHKVHRDVKPSNVLVEPSGRVKILDFGLIADVDEMGRSIGDLEVVGTPAYMAPEQAASRAVGPAADWYAVGVLLYEAMTGEVPFSGAPLEVLLRKQQDEPPPPSALVAGLPADLDDLCARLLHFDPAARPTGSQILQALGAFAQGSGQGGARASAALSSATISLGVPFVGRERQMGELRQAYEHVRASGKATTVVVRGESGIGKSCLVRNFTASNAAQEKELLLFSGRCYEREAVPYKALDGVVDEIARYLGALRGADIGPLLPSRLAPLVQVFPVLRRVEAITQLRAQDEAVADVHELRARAFDAMRELLSRIAERRPVIVVIDDLQWADEDSLALLNAVLRPPDPPRVLLVVTVRDDPNVTTTARTRQNLAPAIPGEVRRIELARLGKEDARALAARLVERMAPGIPVETDTIATEADGHPLFIDEIVRHLFAVGASASSSALKLEEALSARVASLEELPRRIVELCALAGSPLPQQAMTRAVEANPSDFARLVSFLRVAHLVRTSGTRGSDVIECFHGRIRDAVMAHLSTDARREGHWRIAVALESYAGADPDLLALMWQGAGDMDKAGKHMLAAADRASAALAFERAAELFERALALRARGTRTAPRAEQRALETKLGDALSNAGRGAKAARAYRAAATGANAAEALDLQRRAADQLLRSGHFDEGLSAILDVLASIGMRLPATPLQALLQLVFWRLVITVRGLGYRLVDASQVSPRELMRIDACYSIASSLSLIDPIRGNLFHARNFLATMRAGEPKRVARALAIEVSYRGTAGGPGWATTKVVDSEARRMAKDLGDPFATGWATATSAVAHYLSGYFEASLALCVEAERIFVEQCAGTTWETFSVRLFAIQSLAHLGRLSELRTRQETGLRWALERGDLYAAVNLRIGHPNLTWLVAGDAERARHEAKEAMRQWSTRGFHLEHYFELLALTNADLYDGNPRIALERLTAQERPMRRSLITRVQLVRLYARNMRARAAVAVAEAEPSSRQDLLAFAERETKANEREGQPWGAAGSTLVRAAAARLRGNDGQAMSLLERAITEAAGSKLALLGAAAKHALGCARGGEEGKALVAEALEALRNEGAKEPTKLIAMVAPGFGTMSGAAFENASA
jgi:hypothetical protein